MYMGVAKMKVLSAQELSTEIDEFLKRNNPTLFAGAGVGVRAGLPTWQQFMDKLATFAQNFDTETASLIKKRASNCHFLEAASVYKTCPEIPVGERYKGLSAPFLNIPDAAKLQALVSLPFFAFITTNYDRSLHDAYARVYGTSPYTVELHDSTMANASYRTEFYIARIHGRAEVAEEMILDNENYDKLLKDEAYIDYITCAFTRYSCLFIGFSFSDPAIQHVLSLVEKRLSPNFPGFHLALLPSDTKDDLVTNLRRVNIDIKYYQTDEQHSALWEAIKLSSQKHQLANQTTITEQSEKKVFSLSLPIEGIKKYIASAYSHLQMTESEGNEIIPLREIAIDGILIGMLSGIKEGKEKRELINELKQYLHIPEQEASLLFETRIEALSFRKYVNSIEGRVVLLKAPEKSLTSHISRLVDGVINRLQVREGKKPDSITFGIVDQVIESVLMIRSWDLGACFAGATNGDIPNVFHTVQEQVDRYASNYSITDKQALSRSITNLFNQPDNQESELLGDLGRVAFGLQLVTNNPCSAYSEVLPEKIYFDASVLMPAIVEGHPYSPAYRDSISRLHRAIKSTGKELSLCVTKDFLNEVISHRKLAIREVNELGLFTPDELQHHIDLYGQDANVFIIAYASRVGRTKEKVKFDEFLNEVAPYSTEDQLEAFLKAKEGIRTERIVFNSEEESTRSTEILKKLYQAYEQDKKPGYNNKKPILIDHEGHQLAKLIFDLERGIKTIFVTADQRFRRLASDVAPGKLGSAIITHRGLVQLIDLLVGVKTDPASLARLLWGGGFDDQTVAISNYFTNIALRYYNDAYSMALPDVLSKITEKISDAAKNQKIDIRSRTTSEQARTIRFMDRFEDEFYANMAVAIQKKDPESTSEINTTRREYLEGKTKTIKAQISYLNVAITKTQSDEEKKELKSELVELNLQLTYFETELSKIL